MPEITAATMRIIIIGSASSSRKRFQSGVFLPSFSLFLPYFSSRSAASRLDKPSAELSSSRRTSS